MFPTIGLSIFIHLFILLLSFLKKLVDFVLLKLRWDLFKVKLSLFLRLKIGVPLTDRAGDSIFRRFFALSILAAVFVLMITSLFSIGPHLKANSNLELVASIFKGSQTLASQEEGMILSEGNKIIPLAILPVSEDVDGSVQR
ncbi:MAG: hypothetical protein V1845_04020 [bacterium]